MGINGKNLIYAAVLMVMAWGLTVPATTAGQADGVVTLEACIRCALEQSADVRISGISLDQARLRVDQGAEEKDWQGTVTSSYSKGLANSFSYSKYYLTDGIQDKTYYSESYSSDLSNELSFSRTLKDYMTVKMYSKNTLTTGSGKSRSVGFSESLLDQKGAVLYETEKNFLEHGVEFTIPLAGYEREKRRFDGVRNDYSVSSQEIAFEQARQEVVEEVTSIYYSLVKNRAIAAACRQEIESFGSIIELMKIQLDRGRISVIDLQEQEIELQNKILKKEQAHSDIDLDCLKLSAVTGLEIDGTTQLEESMEMIGFEVDPKAVRELVFGDNRDLKKLYLERDKAAAELSEVGQMYRPSVSLSLGYNLDGQNRTFALAREEYDPSYSAAVSMEYPFWNDGQIALDRSIRRKELEKIEQKIEKTGKEVMIKVLDGIFRLEKIEKEYENILKRIELTERNVEIAEIRFEQGKIDKLDLLQMRFRLNSQKTSRLETIARYNSEVLKLKGYLDRR